MVESFAGPLQGRVVGGTDGDGTMWLPGKRKSPCLVCNQIGGRVVALYREEKGTWNSPYVCGTDDSLTERRCSLNQETLFSRSREQRLPCWRTASFSVCLFGAISAYVLLSFCRRFRRFRCGNAICRLGYSGELARPSSRAGPPDSQFPLFLRVEACA